MKSLVFSMKYIPRETSAVGNGIARKDAGFLMATAESLKLLTSFM
jgi:hypothetical protein